MQDFYQFKRRNNFIKIPAATLVSSLQRKNVHLLFKHYILWEDWNSWKEKNWYKEKHNVWIYLIIYSSHCFSTECNKGNLNKINTELYK